MRLLLLLPRTSYRAQAYLEAAADLGLEVTVGTDHSPALASSTTLALDLARPELAAQQILRVHARSPFAGVLATEELGAKIAALLGPVLGVEHNSPASIDLAHNKIQFRRCLAQAGVASPRFTVVDTGARCNLHHPGYPCVVKPPGMTGGRAVIRADEANEFPGTLARVRTIAAAAGAATPVLVEHYLEGRECALEGTVEAGKLYPVALFDKPRQSAGPAFEETLLITPSRLAPDARSECIESGQAVVDALGLRTGPVHIEFKINRDGVWPLEIAARPIGGQCASVIRLSDGTSWEHLLLRQAAGAFDPSFQREPTAVGIYMIPVPRAGRLARVVGIESTRTIPGVIGVAITIPRGARVEPLPEAAQYVGFVFARAATADAVEDALTCAATRITVLVAADAGNESASGRGTGRLGP